MGKIFYIMGKSASGKDTVYKTLRQRLSWLRPVVPYTTRPIREGERNGEEYFFTTDQKLQEYLKTGKVIESRTYQTVFGPWSYFTLDDGQICLDGHDYLMIGTLESYEKMRGYFGSQVMVPLYLYVDDGLRLERALARERGQKAPRYEELCRRFLADAEDFKEENLERCGIVKRYDNGDLEHCLLKLELEICADREDGMSRMQEPGYCARSEQ